MAKNAGKLLLLLFLGALSMTIGSIVAGDARADSALSGTNFFMSAVVSVTLFLIGGVLWIVVAAGMKHHHD
ncbi:MAG: hypothetical protein HY833_00365 [Candidatus Aenigmarchaeota archaeon]|nr:hypothetical protein [Candidatus Aenigmarchaeota archaeon]